MSHYCDVMVASLLRHLESHELDCAKNNYYIVVRGHELWKYGE